MLQIERTFFNPKFDQICPKIDTFRPCFGLQNPQKVLGIPQLGGIYVLALLSGAKLIQFSCFCSRQGWRGKGISTPTPIPLSFFFWESLWGSPQGKIIFLFSTQFHGYGDPYRDIRMDIHTDIAIPMELG